jgi:hypothetical protein
MADKKSANASEKRKKEEPKQEKKGGFNYMNLLLVVLAVAIIALAYVWASSSQPTFQNFRSAFDSARNISIYVQYTNSSFFVSANGCASSLIEKLTSNQTYHKAPGAISFFVINETSCTYLAGLGTAAGNYSTATPQQCINMAEGKPSIFLQPGQNGTQVTRESLTVTGTYSYVMECGIASELP